jgi:hypothetical protein
VLSFRDRTLSALTARPSSSSSLQEYLGLIWSFFILCQTHVLSKWGSKCFCNYRKTALQVQQLFFRVLNYIYLLVSVWSGGLVPNSPQYAAASHRLSNWLELTRNSINSFFPLIALSGVGTTCFYHVVKRYSHLFYDRPPALRQLSLGMQRVATTANAAETNGLTCLPSTEGLETINFGHPSDDWPLPTFLNFGGRTLIVLSAELYSSSKIVYIHTYHSRFISKGVTEASQIFFRDAHILPKLLSYEEYCTRDRW